PHPRAFRLPLKCRRSTPLPARPSAENPRDRRSLLGTCPVRPPPDDTHTLPSMWSPGFMAKLRLPATLFTHRNQRPPAIRVVKYPLTALTIASPTWVRQLSDISCLRSLRLDT